MALLFEPICVRLPLTRSPSVIIDSNAYTYCWHATALHDLGRGSCFYYFIDMSSLGLSSSSPSGEYTSLDLPSQQDGLVRRYAYPPQQTGWTVVHPPELRLTSVSHTPLERIIHAYLVRISPHRSPPRMRSRLVAIATRNQQDRPSSGGGCRSTCANWPGRTRRTQSRRL